jgi:FMN phosphatase YigB (HAD superfamily)
MWAQGFERKNTIMVGDRWTDILAARQAGIRSILISSNIPQSYLPSSNGETPPSGLKPNFTVNDFRGLTQLIKKLKIEI